MDKYHIRIVYIEREELLFFMEIIKFKNRAIRQMNYTRMISLPKVWLEKVGLDVGNMVEMEMNEKGELILRKVVNEND